MINGTGTAGSLTPRGEPSAERLSRPRQWMVFLRALGRRPSCSTPPAIMPKRPAWPELSASRRSSRSKPRYPARPRFDLVVVAGLNSATPGGSAEAAAGSESSGGSASESAGAGGHPNPRRGPERPLRPPTKRLRDRRAIAGFLDIPARSVKPRERGITHVIDRGLSVAEVERPARGRRRLRGYRQAGLGHRAGDANLEAKLERYSGYGAPVVLGGTLTELAIRQGRVEGLIGWLRELRLCHVEVSDGTITLDANVKTHLIQRSGVRLHGPVRGRQQGRRLHHGPVRMGRADRTRPGGRRLEGDHGGTRVGHRWMYRADGEVRTGLMMSAHAIDPDRLISRRPNGSSRGKALRHRVQSRQHRCRRRALAGDAASGAALGHRRALRARRCGE